MALADGVSFIAASTGIGTFVFGTARPSLLSLAQAVSDGELVDGQQVSYVAQDSLSAPTQREWGHGAFSASGSGSIARTTILGGTAGPGTAVNFSIPPIVSLTVLASDFGRSLLIADANYYVDSATGSDSNPGTALLPLATLQYAWDSLAATIDLGNYGITINLVGAGPYTLVAGSNFIGGSGASNINIVGAGSGTTTINDLTFGYPDNMSVPTAVAVDSVTLDDNGSGYDIRHEAVGEVSLGNINGDIALGPATTAQLGVFQIGSNLYVGGNVTLKAGTSGRFAYTAGLAYMHLNATITISGTPAYSVAFQYHDTGGVCFDQSTYTGSATGIRYLLANNAVYESLAVAFGSISVDALPGDTYGRAFQNATCAFVDDLQVVVPTTGTTVAVINRTQDTAVYLNPVGVLATLTVNLPAKLSGFASISLDGQHVTITTSNTLTALTVATTDGTTVVGSATTLAAGSTLTYRFQNSTNSWYLGV